MKKTVIALAVAAAMPVTAMADVTITGSVTAKYYVDANTATTSNERKQGGLDVDSDLDISSTEILTNGMTATASFDIGKEGDDGKLGLEGDFGALTIGSALDSDGAFQSADIGGVVADAEDAAAAPDGAEDATTANAVHYAKTYEVFDVEIQQNGSTTSVGTSATANNQTESTQFGMTIEVMEGLDLGYGYSKDKGATDNADVLGLSYAWDDFVLTYGQGSKADGTEIDGILTVQLNSDEVAVKYTHDSADDVDGSGTTSGSGKDKIEVTYTGADNGVTVAMEYDQDEDADNETEFGVKMTYETGNLTLVAERKQDESTDASVAWELGNANMELARDGSKNNTTLMYKVSF